MTDITISARRILFAILLLLSLTALASAAQTSVVYQPKDGPGHGKHIVFLSGDEEYRSEEGLPMLAKILSQRHGFKCTVLFALDPDGTINPDNQKSLPDAQALDSADAIPFSKAPFYFYVAAPEDVPRTGALRLCSRSHAFLMNGESAG